MIVEYKLQNPLLQGEFEGWCQNWKEGSIPERVNLSKSECWNYCNTDVNCRQAVFEFSGTTGSQCWLGINQMLAGQKPSIIRRPGCNAPGCSDTCFAKGQVVPSVEIHEEKFISNDVVSTVITASRPIVLEISGHSFDGHTGTGQVVSLNGRCSVDVETNSIRVQEAGVVQAEVGQSPNVFKEAKLMYDGMSGVISASHDLENINMYNVSDGVCGYTFELPVGNQSVTLSWTMADDYATALQAVQEVLGSPQQHLLAKTIHMDNLLTNVVPYFRCSDPDVVKIYYFLWSIYLMYFTQGDEGMQILPHTQTAFNNFLGMHRYDAVFQILVGSWASPVFHDSFANGNVLIWSELLNFRRQDQLPDNFGTEWVSGCYGSEMIGHVIGAWQVYEHSGNQTFLAKAYAFYKELFWDGIHGMLWMYAYDSVLCLNKMAEALGNPEDAKHWNATVNMANLDHTLSSQWDSTRKIFGAPAGVRGI